MRGTLRAPAQLGVGGEQQQGLILEAMDPGSWRPPWGRTGPKRGRRPGEGSPGSESPSGDAGPGRNPGHSAPPPRLRVSVSLSPTGPGGACLRVRGPESGAAGARTLSTLTLGARGPRVASPRGRAAPARRPAARTARTLPPHLRLRRPARRRGQASGRGGPLGTRSHRCDPTRGPGLPEEAPPHLLRPGGLGAPLWARTSGRFTALAQWLNATLSPGMGGAAEGQSSGPRKGPLLSRACCPQVGSWDGQQSAPDLPVVVATPPSSPCPVMPSAVQLPLSLDLAHGSQRVSSPRARGPGPEAPQPPIWSGDRVGGPKPPPSHTEGALRGPYD